MDSPLERSFELCDSTDEANVGFVEAAEGSVLLSR